MKKAKILGVTLIIMAAAISLFLLYNSHATPINEKPKFEVMDQTFQQATGNAFVWSPSWKTQPTGFAQSFTPTIDNMTKFSFKKSDTATPLSEIVFSLNTDENGLPGNEKLCEKTITDTEWSEIPAGDLNVACKTSLLIGKKYYITVMAKSGSGAQMNGFAVHASGAYTGGQAFEYLNGVWIPWKVYEWSTADLFFKTYGEK